MRTFVIPQVPGTIKRSTPVDGVIEFLVKSKKYVVPIAALNPYIAGSLIAADLVDGRFHPDPHAEVYSPTMAFGPGHPANTLAAIPSTAPLEIVTDDKSASTDRKAPPDPQELQGTPDPKP